MSPKNYRPFPQYLPNQQDGVYGARFIRGANADFLIYNVGNSQWLEGTTGVPIPLWDIVEWRPSALRSADLLLKFGAPDQWLASGDANGQQGVTLEQSLDMGITWTQVASGTIGVSLTYTPISGAQYRAWRTDMAGNEFNNVSNVVTAP